MLHVKVIVPYLSDKKKSLLLILYYTMRILGPPYDDDTITHATNHYVLKW